MTNTVSGVYGTLTSGVTGTFDGLLGIAVAILAISIIYAMIKGHTKNRVKVG